MIAIILKTFAKIRAIRCLIRFIHFLRRATDLLCFVTGSPGFIGSNLVKRLLSDGHSVVGYETSRLASRVPDAAVLEPAFTLVRADLRISTRSPKR